MNDKPTEETPAPTPEPAASVEVTIEKLTVTGGVAADPGTSSPANEMGGGLLVQGRSTLHLRHLRITDNFAKRSGGGVTCLDTYRVTVFASEVTDNEIQGQAPVGGAGFYSSGETPDSQTNVSYSTFSNNRCIAIPVSDCPAGLHLRHNNPLGTDGLGLYNSTISGNRGIGVFVEETNAFIGLSTIYGNQSYGIYYLDLFTPANGVSAQNTIIADNDLADCYRDGGTWLLQGFHNLSSDSSCDLATAAGDLIEDPQLHPLGFHSPPPGRIARSHHPRWLSPVVDAGMSFPAVTDDQDGYPRPSDGELPSVSVDYDIGAVEELPCVTAVDLPFANQTITGGVQQACRQIIADPNVIIDGTVVFTARDSVVLGEGFQVTSTSDLTIVTSREAGAPAP